jgi:hypothetical protein
VTPQEAETLAARVLAAIDAELTRYEAYADRERVQSDLLGIREVHAWCRIHDVPYEPGFSHARRYTDGLKRTAALYGIETS